MTERRVFESQTFTHVSLPGGSLYGDAEFRRCTFQRCGVTVKGLSPRTTIRNVHLIDSRQGRCYPGPVAFEDSVIDGMRNTAGTLILSSTVFRRVTVRGRIDSVLVRPFAPASDVPGSTDASWRRANSVYYQATDWALDIREAEFVEVDLSGIPARLVRRDPETQVVVTRSKALARTWQQLDLSDTYWTQALERLVEYGHDDVVLVAGKWSSRFRHLLDGLKALRDAGVAEPD